MSDLMITGIIDGPLTGGIPKAIEFYVLNDIPDLSIYGFGSANNGGGSEGQEYTFSGSASAGDYIYIATETTGFTSFFGFAPTDTSFAASINGDDAIELFMNGMVVDVFGDINLSGTGQPWDYMDGWAYRVPGSLPDGTFNVSDWTFSSPNALDGSTTNDGAATPFPLGTYAADSSSSLVINEMVVSTTGTDREFIELLGSPSASLDGVFLLEIESGGEIDTVLDFSGQSLGMNGYFLATSPEAEAVLGVTGDISIANNTFTNASQTYLLVRNFTGASGDDLDLDDDGTIDVLPWDELLDDVAFIDDDNPIIYSSNVVGPDGAFLAPGGFRDPDGTGDFVQHSFSDPSAYTPIAGNNDDGNGGGNGDWVAIYEIQGAAHTSPLAGQAVITTGIVTAVDSNGFYLQDPTGDGDIATSDAIFVFTGGNPGVSVGDELQVEGTVSEFTPGGVSTRNLSTTQLSGSLTITTLSTGNALPEAVIIGANGRIPPSESIDDDDFSSFDPAEDGIDFFESLEAMRVTAQNLVAVAGTNGFGEIFAIATDTDATGISDRGTLNISPDDFNPERIQINEDSDLFDFEFPTVDVGAELGDVTGVVGYSFGNFEIYPTEDFTANIQESVLQAESSSLTGSINDLTIASYNVLNLDPNDADGDTDIADGRFAAIAAQIVNNLNSPDIIGLQEIQDNNGSVNDGTTSASVTLQLLVDAIAAAGGPQYEFIDNTFITDGQSGGQPGGNIRTAFLYNPDRVDLVDGSVQPIGSQAPGATFAGARLPLVATFEFNGQEITVVDNHFSSKGGSAPILGTEQPFEELQEDPDVNGSLNERREQAQAVNDFVDGIFANGADANVVVLGDLNEFEFVSPLDILAGTVESLNAGQAIQPTGEAAVLTNLINNIDPDERYSFIFQGNSQQLDHILVSNNLLDEAEIDIVHVNTEFAETDSRASDHDPVLASLFFFNQITGTDGNDTLVGTDGRDRILGFGGNDCLTGGAGADLFVYQNTSELRDRITDFEVGVDQLVFTDLLDSIGYTGTDPLADGVITLRQLGAAGTRIEGFGGPGRSQFITLEDVTVAELSSAVETSFVF